MTNYRKIYEAHNGPIPLDEEGRSFDIHHIDGNRDNNDITNLLAVSAQDHFDIHYNQGDYGACSLIAIRLNLSPQEKSKLASQAMTKRTLNGNNPGFNKKDGECLRQEQFAKIELGTHPFQSKENKQITINRINQQLEDGTHPWLDSALIENNRIKRKGQNNPSFKEGKEKKAKRMKEYMKKWNSSFSN